MSVLVTGGAGYIGAHVVELLLQNGETPVIVDDLSTGFIERVKSCSVHRIDLSASASVAQLLSVFQEENVDSVIHFAARKRVDESVRHPAYYYQQNVGGLSNLLLAMEQAGVSRFVYSSSAAVYGDVEGDDSVPESYPTEPVNPYGRTKLVGEMVISEFAQVSNLSAISLRYFNVAGAGRPELGDRAVLNLVPMVFEQIDAGRSPLIFGDDYDTPDGTCVRDFIHVSDLAQAHISALAAVRGQHPGHNIYNVGTGSGTSVREIIGQILEITNSSLPVEVGGRRAGDPARVVADPTRISVELGWRSQKTVYEIIESAWCSHQYFNKRL